MNWETVRKKNPASGRENSDTELDLFHICHGSDKNSCVLFFTSQEVSLVPQGQHNGTNERKKTGFFGGSHCL